MPLYTFLYDLLNVLVQIANKMGLQKKNYLCVHSATGMLPNNELILWFHSSGFQVSCNTIILNKMAVYICWRVMLM
jgi:hypothetical protein